MKLILDAKSSEYKKLKDFFNAQNKDHLIYLLIKNCQNINDAIVNRKFIESIDLNEMFEYRIGERVLDLNMKDKK